MRLARLLRIVITAGRHGLDEFLVGPGSAPIRLFLRAAFFWADRSRPRGERLREAFQELGPIFVKFGQVLSIRPDLIPVLQLTQAELGWLSPAALRRIEMFEGLTRPAEDLKREDD